MDANIIKVGNSNGIILPATILKELKLSTKSTVRIDVEKGAIVIRPGVFGDKTIQKHSETLERTVFPLTGRLPDQQDG